MRKIASLLILVGLVVASVAAGVGQAKTPVCNGTKIDPVNSGTYSMPFGSSVGSITITVNGHDSGATFDFQTGSPTHVVTSVGVKGGPTDPLVTAYEPAVSADTGLHSAYNPTSGTWYGLSYLCFQTADQPGDGGGPEE